MMLFSRFSVRTQLIGSYLLLLTLTLGVIVMTLLVFFSSLPAPARSAYQRLAVQVRGTESSSVMQDFNPRPPRDGSDDGLDENRANWETVLDNLAISRDVRIMGISRLRGRDIVFYDSADMFTRQQEIDLKLEDDYQDDRLERTLDSQTRQLYGSFQDTDGEEWVYGGLARSLPGPGASKNNESAFVALVFAEPRSTQSFTGALAEFGNIWLTPLVGAGLTGLFVALLLAFLISRGIAHPLQGLARGAEAVADGKYDYTVLETGPPEIRAVAQAFNRMSSEVRTSQQSQREFLASVSHDLKTPLTSIQGYSQAIVDGATPDVSASAAIIHDEAARLNRMVLELTDLMRIQSGRFSMKLTALDISAMAEGIGQRLQMMADKKQIQLHVQTDDVPQIAGDGDRMAQVFNNLVSNAIKYTPNGGEVWLQTHTRQSGVEITVRDTGEGIPKEDLSRIFERFYRVDKVGGPQRGTGLGLAISREIIAAHGGRITVHSDGRNRGSTFSVWLPLPENADYTIM